MCGLGGLMGVGTDDPYLQCLKPTFTKPLLCLPGASSFAFRCETSGPPPSSALRISGALPRSPVRQREPTVEPALWPAGAPTSVTERDTGLLP